MDYQGIIDEIREDVRAVLPAGRVADYIPMLASVPREKFGMAVQTIDGRLFHTGDAEEVFSIQSISKVYSLTLALTFVGDALWKRVGRHFALTVV